LTVAQKPDGKAARTERVTFTRPAAERIAKVVRQVEGGDRDTPGITFGNRVSSPAGTSVKLAYYTATSDWVAVSPLAATSASNTKTVQFCFPTSTPFQTALCVNHMAPLPLRTTVATLAVQIVVMAKDAGQWRLIGAAG
jgi:hypothetical protein